MDPKGTKYGIYICVHMYTYIDIRDTVKDSGIFWTVCVPEEGDIPEGLNYIDLSQCNFKQI